MATAEAKTEYTIYGKTWEAALGRMAQLDEPERCVYAGMLAHLEAGWEGFAKLQDLCDETPPDSSEEVRALRYMVELEVVDLFRWIVTACARLIPGVQSENDTPGMIEIESEAETLLWYLLLTEIVAHHPGLPVSLRSPVHALAAQLIPWVRQFQELLGAMAQLRDGPDDGI